MEFDYSKLAGKIVERFGTRGKFAKAINISEHSISKKINNNVAWTQIEIKRICDILNIKKKEIPVYFFTPKVQ